MAETFQPLAGLRVVEMTHMIMGPSTGMFLGLLGAEVIKVEPPAGDKTRHLTGMGRGFYPTFNRGKKSVTLDTATEAGRSALHRLLGTADVFVENFRDGSLEKIGLGPEALRTRHPRLILSSLKGFLSGPYQDRTAMDEVVQMMTGMAYMTGPSGRPLRIGSSANDIMGGLFGAFAVLAALIERGATGQGRTLRTGLFENCLFLVSQHMVLFELEGREPPPMPERDFAWAVYDIFETAEGKQVFLSAVTEGQWVTLCDMLDLGQLRDDPRLQTRMAQIEARDWTIPIVAEAVRRMDYAALARACDETGISYAPINRPAQMYDDPHVNRPGGLWTSRLPDGQTYRAPSLPVEADGQGVGGQRVDIAALGADTDAVLAELGLSAAEIAAASGQKESKT